MILVLLDNLFFSAKINQAAEQSGLKVKYSKRADEAFDLARAEVPSLIILDLDAAKCSPFDLIKRVKADEEMKAIPTLGFFSHVNTGVQQQAREAGCDRVLARSVFDRNLPAILSQIS